jgi:hypothetical protein
MFGRVMGSGKAKAKLAYAVHKVTRLAFVDHGHAALTLEADLPEAQAAMDELARLGISEVQTRVGTL